MIIFVSRCDFNFPFIIWFNIGKKKKNSSDTISYTDTATCFILASHIALVFNPNYFALRLMRQSWRAVRFFYFFSRFTPVETVTYFSREFRSVLLYFNANFFKFIFCLHRITSMTYSMSNFFSHVNQRKDFNFLRIFFGSRFNYNFPLTNWFKFSKKNPSNINSYTDTTTCFILALHIALVFKQLNFQLFFPEIYA